MIIKEVLFLWMGLEEADPEQNEEIKKLLLDGGLKYKHTLGPTRDEMIVSFDEKISVDEVEKCLKKLSKSDIKGISLTDGMCIYLSKK